MGKAKKKSRHSVQSAQDIRKSGRATKPSQRLKEAEVVAPIPDVETDMSDHELHVDSQSDDGVDFQGQLSQAHEKIMSLENKLQKLIQVTQTNDQSITSSQRSLSYNHDIPSTSDMSREAQQITMPSLSRQPVDSQQNPVNTMDQEDHHIRGMLADTLSQMINPTSKDKEGERLISHYLILGSTLDPKIKSKIGSKEYIELSSLTDRSDPSVSVSVQNNGTPTISLKPNKAQPPTSFYQWLRLFGVYSAVYLQKFPEQAPAMMTYISHILDLFTKHQGFLWRTYDEEFRKIRAYVDAPWHNTNWDLMLQTSHKIPQHNIIPQRNQPFRRGFNQQQGQPPKQRQDLYRTPRGHCFSFDKNGQCTNKTQPCPYKHECTRCGKRGHSKINCYSKFPPKEQNREPNREQPGVQRGSANPPSKTS